MQTQIARRKLVDSDACDESLELKLLITPQYL